MLTLKLYKEVKLNEKVKFTIPSYTAFAGTTGLLL